MLCGRSTYFDTMYLPPWEEARTGVVLLRKSAACVRAVLSFLYTGALPEHRPSAGSAMHTEPQ